jgi:hypothetical protein
MTIGAVGNIGAASAVSSIGGAAAAGTIEGESSSLLPEPTAGIGSNAAIEIAMLLCKVNGQERDEANKLEDAENVAAERDNAERVRQMEQKACDDQTGALVSGFSGIVAGGLTMASGFAPDGLNPKTGVAEGTNWRSVLSGGSMAVQSGGTAAGAGFKYASDIDDAGAAKGQAAADADVRAYNHAESQRQAAAQAIQQVEQYLQGILQTQAATTSAATGYRG